MLCKLLTAAAAAAVAMAASASDTAAAARAFETAVALKGKMLTWDTDTTCGVIGAVPLQTSVVARCKAKGVDGTQLLELQLTDLNPAASKADIAVYNAASLAWFNVVRGGGGAKGASHLQTDLQELRSMDRAGFTRALMWLSNFPRWTTWSYHRASQRGEGNPLHMFDPAHPHSDFSWTQWLFAPQTMMYEHFSSFVDTNPWHARGLMINSCAMLLIELAGLAGFMKAMCGGSPKDKENAFNTVIGSAIGSIVMVVVYNYIFWPLAPRFLCDFGWNWIETGLWPTFLVVVALIVVLALFAAASDNNSRSRY